MGRDRANWAAGRGSTGADLARGRDLAQRSKAGEGVAFGQPGDVGDDPGGSGLDPAVVAIDGLGGAIGPNGPVVQEQHRIVVHREAVRLDAEDVIGLSVENGLSRLALALRYGP
jgi:hypothetical protein